VRVWFLMALVACSRHHGGSEPEPPPPPDPAARPTVALADAAPTALCVTMGLLSGRGVDAPTFRAVARGFQGDAASVKVTLRGGTAETRALASGQQRRQLGLKLRAADGCNLVYVMWRLDPKPKLDVSVKSNPGARTAKECGTRGYTKVRPVGALPPPALDDGAPHELHAEIAGDALTAWIDGRVAWQGKLPDEARDLAGPAGLRSDNLAYDITALAFDSRPGGNVTAKCIGEDEPAE
jgi:hypothetical protein